MNNLPLPPHLLLLILPLLLSLPFPLCVGDGKTWKCASCTHKKATQCCFCETKSQQLFRRPTYPNCFSWVHTVCLHASVPSVSPTTPKAKGGYQAKKVEVEEDDDVDTDACVICAEDVDRNADLQRVSTEK